MNWETEMQRLCCEENRKALIQTKRPDERIGEIEMRDGLPGFVFEWANWTSLRSYDRNGGLHIKKMPKGTARWYRISAILPLLTEPCVDWYFAPSQANALEQWQAEAIQSGASMADIEHAKIDIRPATGAEAKNLC